MWHGFCTSITHIYSGILSGITTFYVAWVLYFHYTHIFWHSIWHHNILFGVYSGLMSHTYILTFYLYDGIHMNSDKTQELAVLYIYSILHIQVYKARTQAVKNHGMRHQMHAQFLHREMSKGNGRFKSSSTRMMS